MAVNITDAGQADFTCDVPRCGWASFAWDTPEQAAARGVQHQNEHDTGELMPELTEFEASVGFVRDTPEA